MQKQAKKRILSIDYGRARVGMASSDEGKVLATALPNVQAVKKPEETVKAVFKAIEELNKRGYHFEKIVVGLPYRFDGTLGSMGQEVQIFIDLLEESSTCPVISWDERLTSVQAERALREANMNRKRRSKVIDGLAAVLILQSYLDGQSNTLIPDPEY